MKRLLLLLPLLALCGCELFRASAFPGYLTLVSGQVSLGTEIPTGDAHSFTLSSLTTPAGEFVFLATSQVIAGTALFVMDGNLNVLQKFTNAQLVTMHGAALPNSQKAILDMAGDVVLLGLRGTPTPGGLTAIAGLGESPDAGSYGFADPPSNIAGFWVSGDQLAYYVYTPWGAGAYRGNFTITGNAALSFNLLDVRADPLRTDAILVLEEMNSSRMYYVLLPLADYLAGITWPFINFYPWFTTDHFDQDKIGYTQNGFIGLQWGNSSTSKFVRFDMTGAMQSASMEYNGPTDIQISTRSAGGWFYIYDRQARIVRRITAYW